MNPRLLLGSGAVVLRDHFAARSVDMVYSDPPFGNRKEWTGKAGTFSDRWRWDAAAEERWERFRSFSADGASLIAAIAPDMRDRSYLAMMAELLVEVRRVLKPTGTLWLHFDDTMGAHLRVLGDVIFGFGNQYGTIVWKRSTGSETARAFRRVHDTVAVFGRTPAAQWRLARIRSEYIYGDACVGIRVDGYREDQINARSKERIGYPTQKPLSLLKEFVAAATLPYDTVLDPTCGSGTTLVAAKELGRQAIGIDMSQRAIDVARSRLFPPAPPQPDLFSFAA